VPMHACSSRRGLIYASQGRMAATNIYMVCIVLRHSSALSANKYSSVRLGHNPAEAGTSSLCTPMYAFIENFYREVRPPPLYGRVPVRMQLPSAGEQTGNICMSR